MLVLQTAARALSFSSLLQNAQNTSTWPVNNNRYLCICKEVLESKPVARCADEQLQRGQLPSDRAALPLLRHPAGQQQLHVRPRGARMSYLPPFSLEKTHRAHER